MDEEKIGQVIELDTTKHELWGAISVYVDKDTKQVLFGIPVSKDEEAKQFLNNLIEELGSVVNPEGAEC